MLVTKLLVLVMSALPVLTASPNQVQEEPGKIWAVLVAGSSGWDNYRHQADICHAYQIFRRHGIPDSQIIVMMYDDIADNVQNPKKGKIFNHPNGPDVYANVLKDYTREDVTSQNFISVLTGNSSAVKGVGSGKVLKSGPNDHVFVNFADHGAPGFIGFPTDEDDLYADVLIKALTTMHEKKMYKKLVFYMEACESGSMFKGKLPKDIEVFATTAANEKESSWACYMDYNLNNYLGDTYSVAWMEDIDSEEHQANQTTETLLKQYQDVVKRVDQSHPQIYGEVDIENDRVMDFLGKSEESSLKGGDYSYTREPFTDAVPSREVYLHLLTMKLERTNDIHERLSLMEKIDALHQARKMVDDLFTRILKAVSLKMGEDHQVLSDSHFDLTMEMMPCYKTLVEGFKHTCINTHKNPYVLGHLYKLVNVCSLDNIKSEDVLQIFKQECQGEIPHLVNVQ